jgi:hypothetical protein
VPQVAEAEEIAGWLADNRPPLVHDFANFSDLHDDLPPGIAYCRTWHTLCALARRRLAPLQTHERLR